MDIWFGVQNQPVFKKAKKQSEKSTRIKEEERKLKLQRTKQHYVCRTPRKIPMKKFSTILCSQCLNIDKTSKEPLVTYTNIS